MVKWLKEKWQILVTIVAVVIAALTVSLRTRGQKKNFENAKDAHEAEGRVNKTAENDLVSGLTNISEDKQASLEKLDDATTEASDDLDKKKKDFATDASTSDELGKDIAKLIGAEFVETNDE